MKKLVILTIAVLICVSSFAQRQHAAYALPVSSVAAAGYAVAPGARTTGIGDTLMLSNINFPDTLVIYASDSGGYVTGTDSWEDQAFAERYDIDGVDSSVVVLGVFAQFSGKVNPASAKTVNFDLWDQGIPLVVTATMSYNGFPQDLIDTQTVPLTSLGIGAATDTLKEFLFAAPAAQFTSFFVGYNIAYNYTTLNGDTIGLASTRNGQRKGVAYTAQLNITDLGDTSLDTVINVQNATLGSDYNWYENYTQNDSIFNNLAIFPIVAINAGVVSGVKGITRNNLTFFGNYPNPAISSTNIKFSLAAGTDVTIQITDMSGRTVNTIQLPNLATGQHIVPVNTAEMPSGDYLYLIRTADGDGIAGKMTVVHS